MRFSFPYQDDTILIDSRSVGPFMTNSFLVACAKTKKGVLIDACDKAPTLQGMFNTHEVTLTAFLQTHAHLDHIGALAELKASTGAPIYLHPEERDLYDNLAMQCQMFGIPPFPQPPPPDHTLEEGQEIKVGELTFDVIHTPGHSPGSVTFVINNHYLFSGDTLFMGSIGRTDLPGGDYNTLMASLKRLLTYPDNAQVFSGHTPPTNIGYEREYNPFLVDL